MAHGTAGTGLAPGGTMRHRSWGRHQAGTGDRAAPASVRASSSIAAEAVQPGGTGRRVTTLVVSEFVTISMCLKVQSVDYRYPLL